MEDLAQNADEGCGKQHYCSGEAKAALEPEIPEWDSYSSELLEIIGNMGKWSVLVPIGKEINWDTVSKSDRKQYKANWIFYRNIEKMWCYKTCF